MFILWRLQQIFYKTPEGREYALRAAVMIRENPSGVSKDTLEKLGELCISRDISEGEEIVYTAMRGEDPTAAPTLLQARHHSSIGQWSSGERKASHLARALDLYRQVLAAEPENCQARNGIANILSIQKRDDPNILV